MHGIRCPTSLPRLKTFTSSQERPQTTSTMACVSSMDSIKHTACFRHLSATFLSTRSPSPCRLKPCFHSISSWTRHALHTNLVGVVPLRIVLDVENQSVRYEELQAWSVAAGDGGCSGRRSRRSRESAALPTGSMPRLWYRQELPPVVGGGHRTRRKLRDRLPASARSASSSTTVTYYSQDGSKATNETNKEAKLAGSQLDRAGDKNCSFSYCFPRYPPFPDCTENNS